LTRRRWIADEVHGNTAALTGEHASHLSRVLRAQIGQTFDIATGDAVRRGKITSISEGRVEFVLGEELIVKPSAHVTLVLAIFKFDRLEWAIEKCTELGVARIVPVIARRTDSHLAAASQKRHERWQRLARQASEQARRADPPEISAPVKLKDLSVELTPAAAPASSMGANSAKRIVLAESDTETRLRHILGAGLPGTNGEVILAIGPEGGWSDDELNWFRQTEWTEASLGETILRAETAAIVATALVLDALK
jgi:16S rRNA (uracil1498-N3)-methyltransferase